MSNQHLERQSGYWENWFQVFVLLLGTPVSLQLGLFGDFCSLFISVFLQVLSNDFWLVILIMGWLYDFMLFEYGVSCLRQFCPGKAANKYLQ